VLAQHIRLNTLYKDAALIQLCS